MKRNFRARDFPEITLVAAAINLSIRVEKFTVVAVPRQADTIFVMG